MTKARGKSDAQRFILYACSLLAMTACGGSSESQQPPRVAPPPKPEQKVLAPLECSLPDPGEGGVYVVGQANNDWQRQFNEARSTGHLLFAKREGEGLTLLDCRVSGKYAYSAKHGQPRRCATDDESVLKARLPIWFAELGGKLNDGIVAAFEEELVGSWLLDEKQGLCANEIDACAEATHVVSRVEVGAYASYLAQRDWYMESSFPQVLTRGSDAPSAWAEKVQSLSQQGNFSCLSDANPDGKSSGDCLVPIVVGLEPVVKAKRMVIRGTSGVAPLGLHASTQNAPTYGVNGPEEIGRLDSVKMCKPELNNCVTPEVRRAPDLPSGTMFASIEHVFRCGGVLSVEGEYWIEANTFREPGLKLCAVATSSSNAEHCRDLDGFKQTNVTRKSNWRTDPWPKFKAEISVPSGSFAAAVVMHDAGNFGTYLRNVTFSAR